MSQDSETGGGPKAQIQFGDGGTELPGMPLKIVILAELIPRVLRTGKSVERRQRIRIDRQSFDEVMAGFGLRAFLDVPDRLAGSKDPVIVELAIESLKSFRPGAIASQIPATRDLLELRGALVALREGKKRLADVKTVLDSLETRSDVADRVRLAIEEKPAAQKESAKPAAAPGGEGLDALLEMVEAPDRAGRGADLARLDALMRHLVSSEREKEKVDLRAVDGAVGEIDAALSAQIDEVVHHPEFRRLEAAWRGLRFLTDRTDFENPIRIEVIATGRETLLPVYDEIVHVPESQGVSQEPISMVVAASSLDRKPEDIDALRALSERGAHLSVPVIASAKPELLGLRKAGELAKLPGLRATFDSPEYAKWNGLRDAGTSRWLAVVFNRFLLRDAYGPDGIKTREFDYVEALGDSPDDRRLWGDPVWAVTTLATRSFGRIGWCTDIMGQRSSGMVEDLPVRTYARPGAEEVAFPLETVISDAVERDLSANGVMALSAALNSDRAFLRFAPTVHAPQHYQDAADKARAKLQSTLPFQMLVGRLVNYALLVESIFVPGRMPEQIAADYDRALRGLMSTAGSVPRDAVQVAVTPDADEPSRQILHLTVRWPGFQSLPGAGEVKLSWPLA